MNNQRPSCASILARVLVVHRIMPVPTDGVFLVGQQEPTTTVPLPGLSKIHWGRNPKDEYGVSPAWRLDIKKKFPGKRSKALS